MQNVNFLELFRTFLFWSKKHSFLSKILKKVSFWLSLLKKNIWEKGRFFDKNHALTPFQNVKFFYFFWTSLFTSKKHSFLSRISKNASFWFFFGQKKIWEKVRFFAKNHGLHRVTPLQNVNFLEFLRTFFLWPKKHSFLSRISKNVSFCPSLLKKQDMKKRSIFRQKTMD